MRNGSRSLGEFPYPAKETDSRFAAYGERFGQASWELDGLEPNCDRRAHPRRLGGVYLSGRCQNWLKVKNPAFLRG